MTKGRTPGQLPVTHPVLTGARHASRSLLLLVSAFAVLAVTSGSPSLAQEGDRGADDGFRLPMTAVTCQRAPTSFPFQGGDCVPADGAVIVVTTEDGDLVATCTTTVDSSAHATVAGCTVSVPFGTTVIVTEDLTTLPPGYRPSNNAQRWPIPNGPPEGPFGGPIFINLPLTTTGTPLVAPTRTPTPQPTYSACTAPPIPTPTLDPSLDLPGYLAVYDNGAMFLEWTEVAGNLAGTLYWTGPQDENPETLESVTRGLTGVLSENRIAVTIPQGLGFTTMLSGVLEGDSLTIYVTGEGGTVTPAVLHPGTLAEYEQAVRALREQAVQITACAQEVGATATAIAERQDAVTNANAELDRALRRMADDTAWLSQVTDFTAVLDTYDADWEQMQQDDQTMRADAEVEPFDCFQLGVVEADLGMVQVDRGQIEADAGALEVIVTSVNDAVTTLEEDIRAARAAFRKLETAVSANTTGEPRAWFTQEDVDDAVTAAEEQIEASELARDEAQERADTYDQDASQRLDDAEDFVSGLSCTN